MWWSTSFSRWNEPDFVVKTHTAVTGVRGTDFGIRLQANSTTILNFSGVTQVANIFPEVGGLDRKIHHVAFSFGPPGSPNSVILHNMQGTSVAFGLPPTLPFAVTGEDRKVFMNQLGGPLLERPTGPGPGTVQVPAPSPSPTWAGPTPVLAPRFPVLPQVRPAIPAIAPSGLTTGTGSLGVTLLNTVTVPPTVIPAQGGGGSTPTRAHADSGTDPIHLQLYPAILRRLYVNAANAPYTQSSLLIYSWGHRTGVYDGYFYGTTDGHPHCCLGNATFASL